MVVLGWGAGRGWAGELAVGPGQKYGRIETALEAAQPGDTIVVHAQPGNKPYEQVALFFSRPRITLRNAKSGGPAIPLSGRGFDYSGRGSTPRAIVQFNKGSDDCLLEGFELSGASNGSHNGAGVRINQANRVTVRRCVIRGNDMGIMSNGDGTPSAAADQRIEYCLIHSNGSTVDPGYNHNLYLGGTSVTLLGCEVHSSLTGNNVKSRAHRTVVLACYVHDSANREFDLVDAKGDTTVEGSDALLAGNIIVKAARCEGNRAVIQFGQDGGQAHDGTLTLVHNTIVTPFISPVVNLSAAKARARMFNTIVWDGGTGQKGQKLLQLREPAKNLRMEGACNWLSPGFAGPDWAAMGLRKTHVAGAGEAPPFVNPGKGDYRLAGRVANITDAGEALPRAVADLVGRNLLEYVPPAGNRDRPDNGKPDLGAYELADKRAP